MPDKADVIKRGKKVETASGKRETAHHNFAVLNEKHLHAALKEWYAQPEDHLEVPVDGSVVDIVRGELLIEIQTGNFSAIKRKLAKLIANHPVRLVYPVARDKLITRLSEDGQKLSSRRSPKSGTVEQLFEELVSFPELFLNSNFSLEILFIQEEEIRRHDDFRGWRRKGWVTYEHQLLKVIERRLFRMPADMGCLIPPDLVEPFSTHELALAVDKPRRLAQKMAYCLSRMGCIQPTGKKGNAVLYSKITGSGLKI